MEINIPVIAGTIATILFAISTLPMVVKAYRTKDLKSYSFGYLVLGNVGNLFYSVYVYNLPPGPIWLLHTFYLIVTGLMLFWYLRYERWPEMQKRLHDRNPRSEPKVNFRSFRHIHEST
ncbi:MAG: hypothetical protein K8L99_02065 [Anaerolineae bacterium]|nr:hypothetical protein [Anaerolineae bacterium]